MQEISNDTWEIAFEGYSEDFIRTAIAAKDPMSLREAACAFARLGLRDCEAIDQNVKDALATVEQYCEGRADFAQVLRSRSTITRLAEAAAVIEAIASDTVSDRLSQIHRYTAQARAHCCRSVFACTLEKPIAAFAWASREAWSAIRLQLKARIECHFVDAQERPDPRLAVVMQGANDVWPLRWMYEHYATPLRTDGVRKVNILFVADAAAQQPGEVLGIANVFEHFDPPQFKGLAGKSRQKYFLDRIHEAMLRCAHHFGWDSGPLQQAYQRVIDEDFRFSFFWKRPLASPHRGTKVQAFVDASKFPAHLFLVFFDAHMQEQRRILLSVGTDGPGAVAFALGDLRWQDSRTVRVEHANGRDYWLCGVEGEITFHYPRAESGDPHGEYDLGRMYFDGQWVLQDRERGLEWMRSAAAKGFAHATRFLSRLPTS